MYSARFPPDAWWGVPLRWEKGRGAWKGYPENDEQNRVLGMDLPTVESVSGLQESVFSLFRSPQFNSRKNRKNVLNLIKSPVSSLSPRWANAVWGLGLLLRLLRASTNTVCSAGNTLDAGVPVPLKKSNSTKENGPTSCGSILNLFRGSQLESGE